MSRAPKAYKNLEFINSVQARSLRILSEYMEPEKRFSEKNIKHTVVFFGSARINTARNRRKELQKYYASAEELSYKLSMWSHELAKGGENFAICTGGGPGIMEAANKGAQRANSFSIGLNISIPREQVPNAFITPELNFEFHYFFMRKLWFLFYAKALIFFPGGYGTLDELFETLTLVQNGKINRNSLVILLYDKNFWEDIIDFKKLIELKFISPGDVQLFHYFSSPDEGFAYLQSRLTKIIQRSKDKF